MGLVLAGAAWGAATGAVLGATTGAVLQRLQRRRKPDAADASMEEDAAWAEEMAGLQQEPDLGLMNAELDMDLEEMEMEAELFEGGDDEDEDADELLLMDEELSEGALADVAGELAALQAEEGVLSRASSLASPGGGAAAAASPAALPHSGGAWELVRQASSACSSPQGSSTSSTVAVRMPLSRTGGGGAVG